MLTYKEKIPDGLYKEYYHNGQLEHKGTYLNGKRHGYSEFYHKSTATLTIAICGNYVNGKLDGLFKFYNFEGKLMRSIFYVNI